MAHCQKNKNCKGWKEGGGGGVREAKKERGLQTKTIRTGSTVL